MSLHDPAKFGRATLRLTTKSSNHDTIVLSQSGSSGRQVSFEYGDLNSRHQTLGNIGYQEVSDVGANHVFGVLFEMPETGTFDVWVTWKYWASETLGVGDVTIRRYGVTDLTYAESSIDFSVDISLQVGNEDISVDANGVTWKRVAKIVKDSAGYVKYEVRQAEGLGAGSIVLDAIRITPQVTSESYSWNVDGSLAQVISTFADNVQQIASYAYDGLGRMIARQVQDAAGATIELAHYVYDQSIRVAELNALDGGRIFRSYLTAPDNGQILAIDQGSTDPSQTKTRDIWAFEDISGTIATYAADTDSSAATVTWNYLHTLYDSFGNVSWAGGDGNVHLAAAPVVWSGFMADAQTGYFLEPAGWYDPAIGRYITDQGGTNGYRAHGNQPKANEIDWSEYSGPGPFGYVSGFGYGIWDSLLFGHFDDVTSFFGADTQGAQEIAFQTGSYWAGMLVGVAGQIYTGNVAGTINLAKAGRTAYLAGRAFQGYAIAGDITAVHDSSRAWFNGTFTPLHALGFAPTIGWAASWYRGTRGIGRNTTWLKPGGSSGNIDFGIPFDSPHALVRQLKDDWCGAACAEMVAARVGLDIDQAVFANSSHFSQAQSIGHIEIPGGFQTHELVAALNEIAPVRSSRWVADTIKGRILTPSRLLAGLAKRANQSPAGVIMRVGGSQHWIVVDDVADGLIHIRDPFLNTPRKVTPEQLSLLTPNGDLVFLNR